MEASVLTRLEDLIVSVELVTLDPDVRETSTSVCPTHALHMAPLTVFSFSIITSVTASLAGEVVIVTSRRISVTTTPV